MDTQEKEVNVLRVTLKSFDIGGNLVNQLKVRCSPQELGDLIGCQQNNHASVTVEVVARLPEKNMRELYHPVNDMLNVIEGN